MDTLDLIKNKPQIRVTTYDTGDAIWYYIVHTVNIHTEW